MKFHYANLENCHHATGFVIVIDVNRAFTNAAFAFARGAQKIIPVATIEEALELKQKIPNALACGEVGGLAPDGFDFGNSPSQTDKLDLHGHVIIQRTGAGTQGVTRSVQAEKMVAASFVVANATIKYVQGFSPAEVTFVVTGETYDGGDEDLACAEYLEKLFRGESPDAAPYLERARNSHDAQIFYNPDRPEFPETDVMHFTSLNKFDFAMPIAKEGGQFVMRAVQA